MADKKLSLGIDDNQLMEVLRLHKDSGLNFRERRHNEWLENYTLYRDRVQMNRLTQRQSVHIPLMKTAIKTLLKDIDDPPRLYFNDLGNDSQREVYYNEYWNYCSRELKLVIKDIIDKKQVLLFGRSFKKLNIVNGMFYWEVVDPQDVLVDRFIDPANLDTTNFLIHEHIYVTLDSLEMNPNYSKAAISELKKFYATEQGLIKQAENKQQATEKNDRMSELGVLDVDNPVLGKTVVELNEINFKYYSPDLDREIFWQAITAENMQLLMVKPLCEVLGYTKDDYWYDHLPWTSWGDDPERTDFWSDGVGDSLRHPNKIVDVFFSQKVENRTLRNYSMFFYNSSTNARNGQQFIPQTFQPVGFGMYPVPGKPSDVMERIEIPSLDDSFDDINFIMGLAEKVSAATAANQGSVEKKDVTLGEIRLALSNAKDRVQALRPLYSDSWLEFGIKYTKLLEATEDLLDDVEITKKGRFTTKRYKQIVGPKEWRSAAGWDVEVRDVNDMDTENVEKIQKLGVAKNLMPNNPVLADLTKKITLEFAGLNANEVKSVMDAEEEMRIMTPPAPAMGPDGMPANMPPSTVPNPPMMGGRQ